MASPMGSVLESKLRLPRHVTTPMPRVHLKDLLDGSSRVPLTLVSAPPGYGKTTLVASWLAGREPAGRFVWVSLSEQDRDSTSFWTYVLTGVERAVIATLALSSMGGCIDSRRYERRLLC